MTRRTLLLLVAFLLALSPGSAQLRKGAGVIPKGKAARQARKAQAVERFSKMPPEQRQKVLNSLPADRRKQVEKNLENYNHLPPDQRQRLQNQYENFSQLPPEKQQAARQIFRRMNELPQDRKVQMRRELARLRNMSEEDRKSRFGGGEFRGAYSADERKILEEMTDLFPAK